MTSQQQNIYANNSDTNLFTAIQVTVLVKLILINAIFKIPIMLTVRVYCKIFKVSYKRSSNSMKHHSILGLEFLYTNFLCIMALCTANTIILIKIFQIENNSNALCLPGTTLFKTQTKCYRHNGNTAVNVKGIERYAIFKYTIVKSVRFKHF